MLGEFAFAHIDLAAPANGPPAANRIDINAQRTRRREHRRPKRKPPALAGRRENDQRVGFVHQRLRLASRAARRASMSSFDEISPAACAALEGAAVISRNLFVQNLQCLSVPFSTLAP